MRLLAFISLLVLCNLYGIAFDMIAVYRSEGIICDLLDPRPCLLSPPADYWLSVVSLALLLPAACGLLSSWISSGFRLLRSTAFLGLLLITP